MRPWEHTAVVLHMQHVAVGTAAWYVCTLKWSRGYSIENACAEHALLLLYVVHTTAHITWHAWPSCCRMQS